MLRYTTRLQLYFTCNSAINSLQGNQFGSSTTKLRVRVLLGQLNSKYWPNTTYTGHVPYYYGKKKTLFLNYDTTLRSVECLVRFVGFIIELLRWRNVLYQFVFIVARLRCAVFPTIKRRISAR